ncbi:hypothetical protein ZIOFF_066614 [Zingiber officinale]|uniref:DUF676 domain-containing protein n=1 Tax=Zingiber officinale TaxID=94328 RepID=A0A8J5KC84_ZINOF|nr:hypothetical protein ZIOFF_066614 [Zingiber officinale]
MVREMTVTVKVMSSRCDDREVRLFADKEERRERQLGYTNSWVHLVVAVTTSVKDGVALGSREKTHMLTRGTEETLLGLACSRRQRSSGWAVSVPLIVEQRRVNEGGDTDTEKEKRWKLEGMNTVWGDLNFGLHRITSVQGSSMASGTDYDFKQAPDHLLVLVHGIMASPSDWTYAKAELERQLGSNFLIYASSCNGFTKTFDGIDRAGKRLAEEISSVVQKTGSLQRISILAHSLGGLFSRYAIAVLYSTDSLHKDQVDDYRNRNTQMENSLKLGSIAGLQPINFITLATPHLGVRGKKQLPFLLGLPLLEKLAPPIAPILVGRTGQQLFLTDEKPNRPPLLLRMASKSDDLEFISSLNSFRNRILYANNEIVVDFPSSSIFLSFNQIWLAGEPLQSGERQSFLRHVFSTLTNVVDMNNYLLIAISNMAKMKPEEMIHGLQRLEWTKVDVSFHSATWPFFAHNNIHVKNEWLYNAGAGVIAHVADSLKHQESRTLIASNL